jgi:hypothetical protein
MSHTAWAQHGHSDITFGYDDLTTPTSIVLENDNVSDEGIQFWESDFEVLDPAAPGDFLTRLPGFATEDGELLFNTGDQVFIRPLNASPHGGVGYVNYYNPVGEVLQAANRVSLLSEASPTAPALVLDGASASGGPVSGLQLIGVADGDGEVHNHVRFDLLDDATAPDGAYGVLFETVAVQANGSPDVVSDPAWLIINHNLDEEIFEGPALAAFGIVEAEAVPEPTSLVLLLAGTTCLSLRRRR